MEQHPINFEAQENELRNKREELLNDPARDLEFQEKLADFGQKLREKYGREHVEKFRAFHILAGSTIPELATEFDLDGDDSIRRFIMNLHQTL
jgi:hypothetical protein